MYAISSAGLTHAMAKACSAGRMERCTCDEAPDLENREAWQWGGCGDNLKYSNKFVKEFLGRKPNKDLRARVDFHNNLVGMKVRCRLLGVGGSCCCGVWRGNKVLHLGVEIVLDGKCMEWPFFWRSEVSAVGLYLGFVTVLQELCRTVGGRPEDCPGLENVR